MVASIRRQRGFDKNAAVLWFIYSAIKAMLVCVHSWCDWIVILRSISSTCVVRVGRFVDRCRGVVVVVQ